MKVLVVGSGGREHALAWKLAQGESVSKVYIAPGNAGTSLAGENVPIATTDFGGLASFVEKERVDLTVVGPEAPLVEGLVDFFQERNLRVFGPTREAAQLEGSKSFAKDFMNFAGIPTAKSETFDDLEAARDYVEEQGAPLVVKADGLAAGKGVTVALDTRTAMDALEDCFVHETFGAAGNRVIIEEFLEGEEVSILAICDGENFSCLPPSQDHKPVGEGDTGPNTGGMGAFCPAPIFSEALLKQTEMAVITPVLAGMRDRGTPYVGILYAGLILTPEGPKVLEFNCRMGDPETQAVLPVANVDLGALLLSAAEGAIDAPSNLAKPSQSAVCVVMASQGYPGSYRSGLGISGLEAARELAKTQVFHAGTKLDDAGNPVTSGGRVLGVTAWDDDFKAAMNRAYEAVDQISFQGAFCRRDIGNKALRFWSEKG